MKLIRTKKITLVSLDKKENQDDFIFLKIYTAYSKIAAIPGSVFPSKLSNIAPPPVLT